MTWRRLLDVLRRKSVADDDIERSSKDRHISELAVDVRVTNDKLQGLAVGAHARLDSYRRVRIGR